MQETSIDGSFGTTDATRPLEPEASAARTPPEAPRAPAVPAEKPSAAPQKPRAVARAKWFVLDVLFAAGMFVLGGTLALYGLRKATILRVAVEVAIVAIFAVAGYLALGWFAPEATSGWSLGEPLHRAAALVALAFALSYAGGTIAFWGWRYSRDPRVGMLLLAIGVSILGGRVAAIGMAFGELRVSQARVYTAAEALKGFKSSISVMKEAGVDPKPMAAVVKEFQSSVYGPAFAAGLGEAWKYRNRPTAPDFDHDMPDAGNPLVPAVVPQLTPAEGGQTTEVAPVSPSE
ncbi:hypothetical protein [Rhizobium leguminosarum]|uniref:hypothetical protein n=1 Tax=Rhizobium leguminosarum TaxID=384 RepID=UPI002E128E24|nr:hypothetical protein U8Q02_39380 [Rhizobium leguminosarum]